jgi:hypothetical protein
MDATELAHIGIAVLNLLTAFVAHRSGRRSERARWRGQDRRGKPR